MKAKAQPTRLLHGIDTHQMFPHDPHFAQTCTEAQLLHRIGMSPEDKSQFPQCTL